MRGWGKLPTHAAELNTRSRLRDAQGLCAVSEQVPEMRGKVGSRKKATWGTSSRPGGKGTVSLRTLVALLFCLFLVPSVIIFGTATQADLFLIHHHLWPSRAGPQTCSFGPSPGNNSDFVQGLICKILSYGRIFLQIFILL